MLAWLEINSARIDPSTSEECCEFREACSFALRLKLSKLLTLLLLGGGKVFSSFKAAMSEDERRRKLLLQGATFTKFALNTASQA